MQIIDYFKTNKACLAPMRAVNSPSYRLLCKKNGAAFVSTQVFWSWEKDKWEHNLSQKFAKGENPLCVQVGGNNPEELKETVEILEPYADFFDFNAGCPYKLECSHKSGSFLLLHLNQLERAVQTVMQATNKPVSVKIRTGWTADSINIKDTIKVLDNIGVNAITVHARTRQQLYTGKITMPLIKLAKSLTEIPIIGNGDVESGPHAEQMMKFTGCDGVMVGRAAMGNPFIFKQINHWMDTHERIYQTFQERKADFLEYLTNYHVFEEDRSLTEIQDQAKWFFKGYSNIIQLRQKIQKAENIFQIEKFVKKFVGTGAEKIFKKKKT